MYIMLGVGVLRLILQQLSLCIWGGCLRLRGAVLGAVMRGKENTGNMLKLAGTRRKNGRARLKMGRAAENRVNADGG